MPPSPVSMSSTRVAVACIHTSIHAYIRRNTQKKKGVWVRNELDRQKCPGRACLWREPPGVHEYFLQQCEYQTLVSHVMPPTYGTTAYRDSSERQLKLQWYGAPNLNISPVTYNTNPCMSKPSARSSAVVLIQKYPGIFWVYSQMPTHPLEFRPIPATYVCCAHGVCLSRAKHDLCRNRKNIHRQAVCLPLR